MSTQNVTSVHEVDSMTEEGERDLDTFSLAPVIVPKRFWRAQEGSKSHPQAHVVFITSQTCPVITQVIVQAQSSRSRSVQSDQRSD